MPTNMLTYRYRVKDATMGTQLQRMGWAVNRVWNYCNEMSQLAWRRDERFLSGCDLVNLCAGAGHELGLHSDTMFAVIRLIGALGLSVEVLCTALEGE